MRVFTFKGHLNVDGNQYGYFFDLNEQDYNDWDGKTIDLGRELKTFHGKHIRVTVEVLD